MTYNTLGFESIHVMGTATGAAGSRNAVHSYVTADAPSVVETADYFLSIYRRVKPGDILMVSYATTPRQLRTYIFDTVTSTSVTILREADDDAAGQGVRAVTATADGLTTGLILATDSFVEISSADANHIATLPEASAATRGQEKLIYVAGATNCELRTPASSNQTINNVDSDGTQEALLTAGRLYRATQHLANGWLLEGLTNLGAVATAVIPD